MNKRGIQLLFLFFILAFSCGCAQAQGLSQDAPFKVGAVFSLTGFGSVGGTDDLGGLLLAKDDVAALGGIAGHPLELVVEDNQSDLKRTASAFKKLASFDKVAAVVGPNWAEFSEVAVPLATQAELPLITPSGYKDGLFKGEGFAFTLFPPQEIAVRVLADLFRARRYESIAVVVNQNAFLEGLLQALTNQLAGSAVKLDPVLRVLPGQHDYAGIVTRLRRQKSDAVLAFLSPNGDLDIFLSQVRRQNLAFPIFESNAMGLDENLRRDPRVAEGVIGFNYDIPGGDAFALRYQKRFNRAPGFGSARAYDALFLIKKAAETCGLEPQQIARCLRTIDYQGLSGRIRFDANGVAVPEGDITHLVTVRNGMLQRFLK